MEEPSDSEVTSAAADPELDEPSDEPAEPPLRPGDSELADAWWAL